MTINRKPADLKVLIHLAWQEHHDIGRAAEALGISRDYCRRRLVEYGLVAPAPQEYESSEEEIHRVAMEVLPHCAEATDCRLVDHVGGGYRYIVAISSNYELTAEAVDRALATLPVPVPDVVLAEAAFLGTNGNCKHDRQL